MATDCIEQDYAHTNVSFQSTEWTILSSVNALEEIGLYARSKELARGAAIIRV